MQFHLPRIVIALAAMCVFSFGSSAAEAQSAAVQHGPILTWHAEPTTKTTVTWLTGTPVETVLGWRTGKAGFGYGDDDDATVLRGMRNRFNRVYIRRAFKLGKPGDKRELALHINYDDAFIAYLNGKEVARAGIESGRGKEAKGIKGHEAEKHETFELKGWRGAIHEGENVLAIEGHNVSAYSSDFSLDPALHWRSDGELGDAVIEQGGTWQYFAGADPPAEWTSVKFKPDASPGVSAIEQVVERVKDEKQKRHNVIHFRRAGSDEKWTQATGEHRAFADTGLLVRIVQLEGLKPATEYAFVVGSNALNEDGAARDDVEVYRFRTAPGKLEKPLRFVTGGDMGVSATAKAMNRQAGKLDPLFALLGGDIAYANGRSEGRWYEWIDDWHDLARTPDGRLVPMVVAIGNHEMGSSLSEDEAKQLGTHPRSKFFYSLFTYPTGKPTFAVDFGDYMSLFILDSDHSQRVADQTKWLAEALKKRDGRPFTFACYHKPTYGTAKPPHMGVRREWCPLFEKHDITCVFENDHHTYKRTHLIRDGKVDEENGILYLGDGAWGVGTRRVPEPGTAWHLAHAESRNHLILVTLDGDKASYQAIDKDGEVFDRWPKEE